MPLSLGISLFYEFKQSTLRGKIMNRYFYAFLLAFSFSAVPTIAQEDTGREIEEVVITA